MNVPRIGHSPGADTQVKLRGWSRQGEGDESSHLRQHKAQAFLHLLGESTWGLAQGL